MSILDGVAIEGSSSLADVATWRADRVIFVGLGVCLGELMLTLMPTMKPRRPHSLESRISNHLEVSNRRSSFEGSHVERNRGIRARTLNRLPHLDRGSI